MAQEFRTITTTATTTITGGGDIGEHTNPHNLSSQARPTEQPQILCTVAARQHATQINQNGQAATTTATKIMSTSGENNNLCDHHYDDDVIQVDENVIYRTVRREDLVDLHHLQLELFPVRYKDEFYESLLVRENTLTVLALQKQTQKLIGVCSCRVYEHKPPSSSPSSLISSIFHFLSSFITTPITSLPITTTTNTTTTQQSSIDHNHNNNNYDELRRQQQQQQQQQRFGYIMTLGVTRDYRRQGLASKMIQILIDKMVRSPYHCSSLTLHCKVDNYRALTFYAKHGFFVEERVRDYYDFDGVREDAFHLVRHLPIVTNNHHGNERDSVTPIDIIHAQQPQQQQQSLSSSMNNNMSSVHSDESNHGSGSVVEEQQEWIRRYGYTIGYISIFCAWLVALFLKLSQIWEENWFMFVTTTTPTTTTTTTTETATTMTSKPSASGVGENRRKQVSPLLVSSSSSSSSAASSMSPVATSSYGAIGSTTSASTTTTTVNHPAM